MLSGKIALGAADYQGMLENCLLADPEHGDGVDLLKKTRCPVVIKDN